MLAEKTIVALATAPGVGGIAVVRISGPEALEVAGRVFCPRAQNKSLAAAKGYTALYGSFLRRGQPLDDGVALVFRAPHSYTGEDVVELSCHGGSAVSRALVDSCIEAGAAPAGRGEFTRRAFLNGKLDLTQAEAVLDLINASGRQGAALAHSALEGALARQIASQQQKLTDIRAHLAAWVDFPEEDVPQLSQQALEAALEPMQAQLQRLVDGYEAGALLRQGVDCAIVGRPNVGKSTLLNLLAGFDRAIVTPQAGTTRDVVEQPVQLGELTLNLFDTAGLRQTGDAIEAEGIRRSYRKLEEAGLIFAVFDGSEPVGEEDLALARRCQGRRALALVNKNDKIHKFDEKMIEAFFSKVLLVSAVDPEERQRLAQAVEQLLGTAQIDPHAASLSGQRQLAAAARAREALGAGLEALRGGYGLDAVSVCVDDALNALYELTGENAGDAVIDAVFEQFCVGK